VELDELQHYVERQMLSAYPAFQANLLEEYRELQKRYRVRTPSGAIGPIYDSERSSAAYVFGYHPNYCVLAARVFDDLFDELPIEGQLTVLCLGAGPAAEAVGLGWALQHHEAQFDHVGVDFIDRNDWSELRERILPQLYRGWFPSRWSFIHHDPVDFSDPDALAQLHLDFRDFDLVVMQNSLNELVEADRIALLNWLAGSMRTGSQLLIIENPESVLKCLVQVKGFLQLKDLGERSSEAKRPIPGVRSLLGELSGSSFRHRALLLQVGERGSTSEWFVDGEFDDDEYGSLPYDSELHE